MTEKPREELLVHAFATLADTLVDDYDVLELLQMLVETCLTILSVDAAGIMLADPDGQLELIASTSEASRIVELIQLSSEAGPCVSSFRTGKVVSVADIQNNEANWPRFRASATEQGFSSVHAVPLRLRDVRIGSLNLLSRKVGLLPSEDVLVAQALADVATIGILQHRAIRDGDALTQQLQHALDSRVIIEQAKGVLSHVHNVSVDDAFDMIRRHARSNRLGLSEVAREVVERKLDL